MVKKSITGMKILYKTPLGETGCSGNPYILTGCLIIQFFDSPPFSHTVSQATFGYLLLTVQHPCDLRDTMPLHLHAKCFSANPLPRETEDFPRGGNHSKHVPLPTYLAWLQPIYYDLGFVFIHVKMLTFLLVVKTLIKSIEQQPH